MNQKKLHKHGFVYNQDGMSEIRELNRQFRDGTYDPVKKIIHEENSSGSENLLKYLWKKLICDRGSK